MTQDMVGVFSLNKIQLSTKTELEKLLADYKYSRAKLWDEGLPAEWHTQIINKIYFKLYGEL